jgi:hypothetical protein
MKLNRTLSPSRFTLFLCMGMRIRGPGYKRGASLSDEANRGHRAPLLPVRGHVQRQSKISL